MNRNYYFIPAFLLFWHFQLMGQDTLQSKIDTTDFTPTTIELGSKVRKDDFNKGIISDPLLLIQGRIPGVQIYNRGGDPNVQSLGRIRGISSLDDDIEPMFVVDGVPNSSIEGIDPYDIESIEVLKDGFAQSKYGARGANGVILINRKKSTVSEPFSISYAGMYGASTLSKEVEVLDRDEFISQAGVDVGSDFDYQSSIRRSGYSQAHGLSIMQGFKHLNYSVSGNYRSINGILNESEFDQWNGNAQLNFNLLDNKLKIHTNQSILNKKQNLSFVEAFKYATLKNPSAPNLAEDAPFEFNGDLYGGYYESLELFDSYNPNAIIDLNDRINNISLINLNYGASFEIVEGLSLGTDYAYQNRFSGFREYGAGDSFYLGRDGEGRGDFLDREQSFDYSNSYIRFKKDIGNRSFDFEAGYTFQEFSLVSDQIFISGSDNRTLVDVDRISEYPWMDEIGQAQYILSQSSERLVAFYNRYSFVEDNKLFLDFGLRYEGSSIYNEDDKWHFYPSARVAYDLGGIIDGVEDRLILSSGFGTSSSRAHNVNVNTEFKTFFTEKKLEYNLGIDYNSTRYSIALNAYTNTVSNLNLINGIDQIGLIRTSGVELAVGLDLVKSSTFDYNIDFIISTYRTSFGELPFEQYTLGSPGGPGFGSARLARIRPGENYGQIIAPVYNGIDQDGLVTYKDVNQDGQIVVFSPDDPISDYDVIGNAIPDFEIGWANNFDVHGFDISLFFRGAFGHSLLNINRLFYESGGSNSQNYNTIVTSKKPDGISESRYSSLYVENASFLKLDNLSISRSFSFGSERRAIRVSLMGQNLITFTGYTGVDPEPSFRDSFGSYLLPGVDRRINYRPSRTISVGLNIDIL